jgi:hypothetical protein
MMMLSQAAFLDLARRFASAEEFARWQIDNKAALRLERAERRSARAAEVKVAAGRGGQVESGLRVAVGLTSDSSGQVAPASAEGLSHPKVKLAVARKAAPLLGLGVNAGEVFAALIDFCNAETLRCCPGHIAIADRLGRTGKYRDRHVRRGIDRLVEAGVLRVAVNAGLGHANAYFPQWERLAEIVAAFEAGVRLKADSGAASVHQTQKKNPTSVTRRKVQRAGTPDRSQGELTLLRKFDGGGRQAEARQVPEGLPRDQALLRLGAAIKGHLRQFPPQEALRIQATIGQQLFERAIVAEVRAKGSGIDVILAGLGPGPPGPNPEVSEALRAKLARG